MEIDLGRVLDALPAMVWTAAPDGPIDFVNRRWSDYTGLGLDQVRGRAWQLAADKGDLPQLLERWTSILASGKTGEMEARLRRFDGKYHRFRIQCEPMRDHAGQIIKWCGMATDVEDLRQAEETLRRRELDFQLIVDSIPVPVAVTTPSGEVEGVNQPTLDYFGRTFEELKGWTASDVVHPDDLERTIAAQLEAHQKGSAYNVESRHRRADGIYRWHNVRGFPLRDPQGHILRWFHLLIDIDERKRAEEALAASERNLQVTIDSIPVLAWSARPDGTAEFLSRHYLDYVGFSAEQARDWGWTAAVHPDDLGGLAATWQAILASGKPGEAEARLRRRDGEYRWWLFRVNPFRDETGSIVKWYGVNTDIDDRKRAEEALKRSEAFLAEGQHLARMGNLSWHVASGEVIWSEQLYRIFEFEPGTVVTLERIASRVHPEDMPLMMDMIERAQRGESNFEYQHRITLPDQSIKYLHLIAHRAGDGSDQVEYIGAVLDVTQRRHSEEALEKLRSELAQVTRIMSLGALTASIAHEVNQPLSGIVTNASTCLRMLSADPPNIEVAQETARRTIRDGNRAADVISRLRSLFSKRTVAIEPVDLNEAVREVIALAWGDLQRSRVVLRTELAAGLPLAGGDRIQLQQVIMNLLRNASDAMSGIDDRPRRLLIRTEPGEEHHVKLTVQDAGVGFRPEAMEQLFQAFYTTKSDGMGIGLAVSRSIIESHGGRLWTKPNVGPGATFSFAIPQYSRDHAAAQHPGASRPPTAGNAQSSAGVQ
ncbi:PAS domain-containing protein [Mesorhizobium sp. BAC0120]|uniref:PAS domain-containing protein n=1 Tax=Mesorhizobium sp. BAC0120 TaxID=3090670 RepID=UPI00298CFC4A|nr:PAS domain-containing protein [Mesorhizobium sp. BAC0120]MDW6024274.1 PAS domain-containing protein [Mesorhizobium sp. BAC0120]